MFSCGNQLCVPDARMDAESWLLPGGVQLLKVPNEFRKGRNERKLRECSTRLGNRNVFSALPFARDRCGSFDSEKALGNWQEFVQ